MRSVRRLALFSVVLGALAWATPASAAHGIDDEQLDLAHLANSPPQNTETNSDIAFWGDLAYSGNYRGFRIIDVSNRSAPQELVNFDCRGAQNDVGVWDTGPSFGNRRLLFLSVDSQQADDDCKATAGGPPTASPTVPSGEANFEGIRVFDVTTPSAPVYLKPVFTDCGSHTHTVIPVREQAPDDYVIDADNPDRVFIYVSSYVFTGVSALRCPDTDGHPTHNKISIVEVPFDDPTQADVLKEVPLHPATLPFEPDPASRGCHDIGAFLELQLAAAACQGEGQVWDISDPANPDTMGAQRILNENINYWHSASFTWDGKVLIFGDEEGGAVITHGCVNTAQDQLFGTGATWFYDRALLPTGGGLYTGPPSGNFVQDREQASQLELICTAHNYNAIPVTNRYLLTSAYYQGGTSILDFTDLNAITERAFFDAQGTDTNPGASAANPPADTWSSYWYNGNIFANDIVRGVDIFQPIEETAGLVAGAHSFGHLNPQTQERLLPGPAGVDSDGEDGTGGGDGTGADDSEPCANVVAGTKRSEKLEGTAGSDRISGNRGQDRIKGGRGDDCLRGGAGDDRIGGGGGGDLVRGGRGEDRIEAGAGDDVVRVARGGRDQVGCGPGDDSVFIHPRKDRATANCESVIGRGGDRALAKAAHHH